MKQKSLKVNFIMNVLLAIPTFIFPLITLPYVSRVLLPEATGKVTFAESLISYFVILAQLGIPTYGIRACAKVRDNREELTRTAQELLIINLVMCVVSYGLLCLAVMFVPKLRSDRLLYVVVGLTIILNSIGMEWLYKALEQYIYITITSFIFKCIAVVSMFLLIHQPADYVLYGGITVLAASASNAVNFVYVHKYIDWKPVGQYHLRRHMKLVVVFFAMACATTIYTNLDNVMLGLMTTDVDVGYYNAAVKIKNILVAAVTSLGVVLLPRASYYVENRQMEEFKRITGKAFQFVFLMAAPLMVYFVVFARESILLISGAAFEGSVFPMQLLMPTLLLIGITNILGLQILVPLGKEKIVLYSELAGAGVDLIVNAVLIPHLAAAGAAIGTLIAEFVVLIVQGCALKEEIREMFGSIHYAKVVIALILGMAGSICIKVLEIGVFPTLLMSAVWFFGVYGVYLLLRKEKLIVEIWELSVGRVLRKIRGK